MSSENKQLAINEASIQQCDLNIVLATVEAESEFENILGDRGNALGFGQVWFQWHKASFEYAASRLNVSGLETVGDYKEYTLAHDDFSMIVAVKTIKNIWNESNKDWRQFTLSYVGENIHEGDYNRRLAIWNKYNNGDTGNAYQNTSGASIINNINSFDVINKQQSLIQPTNYGVVKNSSKTLNVLYGRRYRVLVSNAQGIALDVSDLRCTFQVTKTMQMQPNMSELTVYNLNADTENRLIREGNRITIEAGYEGEQYGLIFEGDIIQPLRDKEDGVTYKLTLISMDGDRFFNNGFTNITLQKGQTARTVVENITNKATNPVKLGSISDSLNEAQLTRGKVVFGLTRDYLRQVAQTQNATFYLENNKVNIIKVDDLPQNEIIDLSPSSGLIGVPAQSENGLTVKCLLNPRITTNTLIHIDNSLIRQARYQPTFYAPGQKPSTQVIRALDNDGIYRVIKITYKGDTRGDDWYCEIEALNQSGRLPGIATGNAANIW